MSQNDEKHYFEQFRRIYPLPPGEIRFEDKPDVRIEGAQSLGIEITNFYVEPGNLSTSEQLQSKLRRSAVAQAYKFFIKDGGANIGLTFGFDKTQPIRDVNELARRLAGLGKRVEEGIDGSLRRDVYQNIPELDFAYLNARELQYGDEIDALYPKGVPDLSNEYPEWADYQNRRELRALKAGIYKPLSYTAKWKVSQVHSFGRTSIRRLNEIISEKNAKAQKYKRCDAYWLLIVVDFMDPAQEQEIRTERFTVQSDAFQRIIIYKTGYDQVVELIPQRTIATPQ